MYEEYVSRSKYRETIIQTLLVKSGNMQIKKFSVSVIFSEVSDTSTQTETLPFSHLKGDWKGTKWWLNRISLHIQSSFQILQSTISWPNAIWHGFILSCKQKIKFRLSRKIQYSFLYMYTHNGENFGVFVCYLQTCSRISPASTCNLESRQWRSTEISIHTANEQTRISLAAFPSTKRIHPLRNGP